MILFDFDAFLSKWPESISSICRKPAMRYYIKLFDDAGIADDLSTQISFIEGYIGNEPIDGYDRRILIDNTRNKLTDYAVSSLASLRTHHENSKAICFLHLSVFVALFSNSKSTNISSTVMEAARNIRRLIVNSPGALLDVPNDLSFLETIEYIVDIDFKKNALPFSFLREVEKGWSVFIGLNSNIHIEIIAPRRKSPHKPHVHTQPLPFSGNDLTVDEPEETNQVDLKDDSPFPIRAAQRDLFRNQIIETREQFGLLLCPVRLSTLEVSTLQRWLFTTTCSPSSVLVVLSMLTALKTLVWTQFPRQFLAP